MMESMITNKDSYAKKEKKLQRVHLGTFTVCHPHVSEGHTQVNNSWMTVGDSTLWSY